jgi:hypothetical protein
MTINKNNTKKYNSYNSFAVTAISKKLNMSKQYVRQCLNRDKNSISADFIKKEYNVLVKKINQLLNE